LDRTDAGCRLAVGLAYFLEACQRAPAAWPVACAVARSSRRDNNSAVRSGDRQTLPRAARGTTGPRRPVVLVPLYGCQAQEAGTAARGGAGLVVSAVHQA